MANGTWLLLFANSGLPVTSALKSCLVMQDVIVRVLIINQQPTLLCTTLIFCLLVIARCHAVRLIYLCVFCVFFNTA